MEIRKITAAILAAASVTLAGCGNSASAGNGTAAETEDSAAAGTTSVASAEETEAAGNASAASRPAGEMRDMTTAEIVKDMGLGINLGNTFEAVSSSAATVQGFETAWGSPVVTQPLIQGYADAGFGVLRIPVAWSNLMADDYTISPELLARVDEVIGWAMDSGMYVIMNIHWDGGWWEKFPEDKDECMNKYTRIWEQLCDYYGSYGDKLMFESLNEELNWDSVWNKYGGGEGAEKEQVYALANEINQKFVDIVRASGGNNEKRHLLIAGYNTDIDLTCDELYKMPSDPAGRCAVSVHYYNPSTFCLLEKDADWGKARKVWGNTKDVHEMENYFDKLKEHFVDNGIPVIMGEYGCVALKNKTAENIRLFNLMAAEEMLKRGICPVLWDTTGTFYDRYTFKIKDEDYQAYLLRIKSGESVREEILAEHEAAREAAKAEAAKAENTAEAA